MHERPGLQAPAQRKRGKPATTLSIRTPLILWSVSRSSSPLRFAGLATQWALMLGVAVWGGLWLDGQMGVKALWVIVLPVAALGISLYQLIKELGRKEPPANP